ncbi:hypothetical protein CLOM_g15923 [Closterium sp. NIES-68]|nr:hypothetical protein CLOM_g15923 [Closterium sp. NIES-68]
MASRVSLNGTVIIASSNAGYEDMLENWVLHLERVGLGRHFIVFAADNKSLHFAQSKWPGQAIHLDLSGQFGEEEKADVEGASRIGSAAFHRVASHRAVYIHHLLAFGFSVLYSDIDIAFLHNPLPFFQKPHSLPFFQKPHSPPAAAAAESSFQPSGSSGSGSRGSSSDFNIGNSTPGDGGTDATGDFDMFLTHDHYIQQPSPYTEPISPSHLNGQPLFCSGFLFFRPTAATKSLVGNWAFRMAKLGRQAGLDQDHLNSVMQWMFQGRVLPRLGVLPPLQFPSGELMQRHWEVFEEVRPRVVMVHANYLTGKEAKIAGLKRAGVWRVKEEGNATTAAAAAAAGAGRVEGQRSGEGATRIMGAAGMVVVTAACEGHDALFHNWYTHMGRVPSLGSIVLASVPLQMRTPGGHTVDRPKESISPRVARATCLLLPPLIIARLLAANVTVVYSDVSSMWLRDARPYFPPAFSLVLPSLTDQDPPPQQPEGPGERGLQGAQGAAENGSAVTEQRGGEGRQQKSMTPAPPTNTTTTSLTPSLLGSLSPWLMALRPSPAVLAMVRDWAVRALRGYQKGAAAAAGGGSGVVSGSEVLKTALNQAVAEMGGCFHPDGERWGIGHGWRRIGGSW